MGCRAPKASPKASNNPVLINGIKGGNLRAKIAPVGRGQKSRNAPVQLALLKLIIPCAKKLEIRRPKSEGRKKAEARGPNTETTDYTDNTDGKGLRQGRGERPWPRNPALIRVIREIRGFNCCS